jgi:hypothetical protein
VFAEEVLGMTWFRRLILTTLAAAAALAWSAAPALAGGSGWHVGSFTPSGQTLSFASADQAPDGIAAFDFTNQPNTALLVTDQGSSPLLGDDRGKNVTATFTITGATGAFTYFGEGTADNPCVSPANTRLFFETSNAGGFDETHFWWSNPSSAILADGTFTVTATVNGAEWSDFFGHFGSDPRYSAGFDAAASNVKSIGLSFGGGCFFENGVGTTDGSGTLTLTSFSVSG